MAFSKDELIAKSIELIKANNLITQTEVISLLPCSRQTYYTIGLDKVDELKDALEANKGKTKIFLKNKWKESDNATLQIALFKLCADADELHRLAVNYTDVTTGGEKINLPPINWVKSQPEND
jgi:hypothetical protein